MELGGAGWGACWIQVFDHNDNLFVFYFDKVGSRLHKPLGQTRAPKGSRNDTRQAEDLEARGAHLRFSEVEPECWKKFCVNRFAQTQA